MICDLIFFGSCWTACQANHFGRFEHLSGDAIVSVKAMRKLSRTREIRQNYAALSVPFASYTHPARMSQTQKAALTGGLTC
ncbi:hypothetical protein, partial [Komagataeibacter xylinus]|uniref:hypothetical protein n=1 Tax=Komagataeibacter xylinus TaxID=28448 RepID=UPI00223228B9